MRSEGFTVEVTNGLGVVYLWDYEVFTVRSNIPFSSPEAFSEYVKIQFANRLEDLLAE